MRTRHPVGFRCQKVRGDVQAYSIVYDIDVTKVVHDPLDAAFISTTKVFAHAEFFK